MRRWPIGGSAPVIGSLFSGYAGLDVAVQRTFGGRVAWFSEIDGQPTKRRKQLAGASALLAYRHPEIPNLGDITTIDFHDVEPVDILTGGFPCQDVSHAGARRGLKRDDTRTGLWGQMARAIDELRPRLVVAENVRGLTSAEVDSDVEPCPYCLGDGPIQPMRALGAVSADLADLGYDARWEGLRASDVAAPHERFRIFILAWDRSRPRPNRKDLIHV